MQSNQSAAKEIVVIIREEHQSPSKESQRWNSIEQASKVVSLVAIPVVLAVVGWTIQDSLAKRSVSQEYVSLAVSILKENKEQSEPSLRGWAVELLNQNSPTKFSPSVADQLKAGDVNLPGLNALLNNSNKDATAISPDGNRVATGSSDGKVQIWEIQTGLQISSLTIDGYISSLAFSPDGKSLAIGSFDSTARIVGIDDFAMQIFNGHSDAVTSVAFTPDGEKLLTRSLDGTIKTWDAVSSRLLSTVAMPQ